MREVKTAAIVAYQVIYAPAIGRSPLHRQSRANTVPSAQILVSGYPQFAGQFCQVGMNVPAFLLQLDLVCPYRRL